jgi:hypothetical protein
MALLVVAALAAALMSVALSPPAAHAAGTDRSECQYRTNVGKERFCTVDKSNQGSRVRAFFSWYYRGGGPLEYTGEIDFSFYRVDNTPCKWARVEAHDYDTDETFSKYYSSCSTRGEAIELGGDFAFTPNDGYFKFSVCGKKLYSTCRTMWIQKTAQRAPF